MSLQHLALACLAVAALSAGLSSGTHQAVGTSSDVWTVQHVPIPGQELNAVSCPSANECIAVGYKVAASGNASAAVVETWRGSRWELASAPGLDEAGLTSVSCATALSCVAVGTKGDLPFALVMRRGLWTATAVPRLEHGLEGGFSSVSCLSASFCVAVGSGVSSSGVDAFAYSFNGSSWVADRISPPFGPQLHSVSCVSSRRGRCTAVGVLFSGQLTQSDPGLVMRLVGGTWRRQDVPWLDRAGLTGISCGQSRCVVVGGYGTENPNNALVAEERMTTWTELPAPHAGSAIYLGSVFCDPSISWCVAVGSMDKFLSPAIEVWDGHWQPEVVALSAAWSSLKSVSCAAYSAGRHICTAVGAYEAVRDGPQYALVMRSPPLP
jgi:hypothetical protein